MFDVASMCIFLDAEQKRSQQKIASHTNRFLTSGEFSRILFRAGCSEPALLLLEFPAEASCCCCCGGGGCCASAAAAFCSEKIRNHIFLK
jgi:hypothetical protein